MPRRVVVHLVPELFQSGELHDGVAVVIDVLRASTTIVHALAAGAEAVIPCSEVDEAERIAARFPPGTAVLGGERKGVRIAGFNLGNSPAEYTAAAVRGKTLVFTTTNGTRALIKARESTRVFLGAFSNLSAVVQLVAAENGPVHLVCAGTNGQITLEDVLCAGAIVKSLATARGDINLRDDSTTLALALLESCGGQLERFLAAMRAGRGGRNLLELGFGDDIVASARWDVFDIVPELMRDPRQIRPAADAQPLRQRWLKPPA